MHAGSRHQSLDHRSCCAPACSYVCVCARAQLRWLRVLDEDRDHVPAGTGHVHLHWPDRAPRSTNRGAVASLLVAAATLVSLRLLLLLRATQRGPHLAEATGRQPWQRRRQAVVPRLQCRCFVHGHTSTRRPRRWSPRRRCTSGRGCRAFLALARLRVETRVLGSEELLVSSPVMDLARSGFCAGPRRPRVADGGLCTGRRVVAPVLLAQAAGHHHGMLVYENNGYSKAMVSSGRVHLHRPPRTCEQKRGGRCQHRWSRPRPLSRCALDSASRHRPVHAHRPIGSCQGLGQPKVLGRTGRGPTAPGAAEVPAGTGRVHSAPAGRRSSEHKRGCRRQLAGCGCDPCVAAPWKETIAHEVSFVPAGTGRVQPALAYHACLRV